MKNLIKDAKVKIVSNSKEVTSAVKMLMALMQDAEIKNFIAIDFELLGKKYELIFKDKSFNEK